MTTVIAFIFIILILVLIHELGHFLVAKAFGVRVDEFGLGYPPRARKLFRWKETVFTLNWLPFGGFVKIFGEASGSELEDKQSFSHQPLLKRLAIVLAGIVANVLLGCILYATSFSIGFLGNPSEFSTTRTLTPTSVIVTSVLENTPAEKAGILPGDIVRTVALPEQELVHINTVYELSSIITEGEGSEVRIGILRENTNTELILVPSRILPEQGVGMGVGITEAASLRLPFFSALKEGTLFTFKQFSAIVSSLTTLLGSILKGENAVLAQVSGPIGIAEFAGKAYTLGIGAFLGFMALISINLAVINLLPFPALDGGRFILEFFTYKGRSLVSPRIINGINQAGFLILILLMLLVTYKDIVRIAT